MKAKFDALVGAHYGAFVRMAQVYEYQPELRRDLVQEILCAIWQAMPGFAGDSSLKTYAFRVAHNVCVTHVSREVKARFVTLEELPVVARDGVADAEKRDARTRLIALMQRLKPRERAVASMYLEGFDHGEIAGVLGVSEENAAVMLHRAKHALKEAVSHE